LGLRQLLTEQLLLYSTLLDKEKNLLLMRRLCISQTSCEVASHICSQYLNFLLNCWSSNIFINTTVLQPTIKTSKEPCKMGSLNFLQDTKHTV